MKKTFIAIIIISLTTLPLLAQKKQQDTVLKREVTLYNPYKPSLQDVTKKSFLPEMNDTSIVKPVFKYDIRTEPFMPAYTITPIKPASLLPDPLPKLYQSYVEIGLGNYLTPLAEISISNGRSKKGAIGIDARHFSTNGNLELQNNKKAFAGYMDNDVSLYGKKFLNNSVLDGSVDLSQKTRYAYGYDTIFKDYNPAKKNIRLSYFNTGARMGLASAKLDSLSFSYDFDLAYKLFYYNPTLYQHNVDFKGLMAKSYKGFYAGSGLEFDYFSYSDSVYSHPRYIASLSPFIKKRTDQWSVKLGFQALIDNDITGAAKFHFYPDLNFGFNIVPSYVGFFADMYGKLVKNEPINSIGENPFIFPDNSLFKIPNTDYSLIIKSGLSGSTGIDGIYQLSASYSVVNNLLMFKNNVLTDGVLPPISRGNFFVPLSDDAEIFNIHGEISGRIAESLTFNTEANFYKYSLSQNEFAWNKPGWEASLGLRYNLMNKIIAGANLNAVGDRKALVTTEDINSVGFTSKTVDLPSYFTLNLSAEYRYTKVLSFWLKLNNISFNHYYEWAFYPSQRFMCLVGFTYSL